MRFSVSLKRLNIINRGRGLFCGHFLPVIANFLNDGYPSVDYGH